MAVGEMVLAAVLSRMCKLKLWRFEFNTSKTAHQLFEKCPKRNNGKFLLNHIMYLDCCVWFKHCCRQ
ncbi:hypothetical protein MKX03_011413 [Papaver bracteatum]|nr:hypothetical protein MKX03_011413 [Papaver bracteatum]